MDATKQLAFYFDQTRCHGCQTCIVACKDWNNVNPGPATWRELHDKEVGHYPTPENDWAELEVFMSTYSCMHCENPACIDACAYKAIYKRKDNGVVVIDRNKCQGYGECIKACPYGAPRLANDAQEAPTLPANTSTRGHTAQKCNFCLDRVAAGLKPSCVGACLMRALDSGTLQEMRDKYPDAVSIADGSVPCFPGDNKGADGRALQKRTTPSILVRLRK